MGQSVQTCFYKGCNRPTYSTSGDCILHTQNREVPLDDFTSAFNDYVAELKSSGTKEWRFDGFQFPVGFDFTKYDWSSNLSFYQARFMGRVKFFDRKMSGITLEGARFQQYAEFKSIQFTEEVELSNVTVDGELRFSECSFENALIVLGSSLNGLRIKECQFRGGIDFGNNIVHRICTIASSKFHGSVILKNCDFNQALECTLAEFLNSLFIEDCNFRERVVFDLCKIAPVLLSYRSHYYERVAFRAVTLGEIVDFRYSYFSIAGFFEACKANFVIKFKWPGVGKPSSDKSDNNNRQRGTLVIEDPDFETGAGFDLRGNRFPEDSLLVLRYCDMSHFLLKGVETERIEFIDCINWPIIQNRNSIADERVLREQAKGKWNSDHWRDLAVTFQGLASNFNDRDFSLANHFQAGVYEARRMVAKKQLPKRGWSDYLWLSLFRISSGYSTNLTRPVLILFCLILVFPFGYWFTSIRPETNPLFWNSFNVSLQVSTLIGAGKEIARGNSFAFNILVVLQMVLTFSLVSLFLLALRRTFRNK